MEGYIAAKQRVFAQQSGKTAVIGVDDEPSRALYTQLVALGDRRVIPISGTHPAPGGVYGLAGELFDGMEDPVAKIIDLRTVRTLTGEHNWQNAAAVYAACRALGLARDEIAAGLASYPGLAHRQELIAVIDGVPWINDSKATNADAAAKALACYGSILWIAGGQPKEGGIASLEPYFPRIRHAFLIGEAMQSFAATLSGKAPLTLSGDLDTAVTQAQALARRDRHQGVVVLLSPACASFDQFENFEHRGEHFRELVQALAHRAKENTQAPARRTAPCHRRGAAAPLHQAAQSIRRVLHLLQQCRRGDRRGCVRGRRSADRRRQPGGAGGRTHRSRPSHCPQPRRSVGTGADDQCAGAAGRSRRLPRRRQHHQLGARTPR